MSQIEIEFSKLKSFEIRNDVGSFPLVTLQIFDVDGSIGKKISDHYYVLSAPSKPSTPEEKAKSYKEKFE